MKIPVSEAVARARLTFPSGLSQPQRGQGFRFGLDSLQLAAFAELRPRERVLDLGCGCGIIALACLLQNETATALGIDINPDMLAHAARNAELLGLSPRFETQAADLRELSCLSGAPVGSFSLVLANPPYRTAQSGRKSQSADKRAACFDENGILKDFLTLAARSLGACGRVCLTGLSERLPELFVELQAVGLTPKRLRFLHGHAGTNAKVVLVEAKANAKPGLRIEPPYIG